MFIEIYVFDKDFNKTLFKRSLTEAFCRTVEWLSIEEPLDTQFWVHKLKGL